MSSPRTSLRSVLRLRPVFEGAGAPGIFIVYVERDSLFREAELKIFLIPIDFPHISSYFLHIPSYSHIFLRMYLYILRAHTQPLRANYAGHYAYNNR